MNLPGSSGTLPEMEPDSRTPTSETESPGCENTKKDFFFFFVNNFPDHHFAHMYGNIGHLLLEVN